MKHQPLIAGGQGRNSGEVLGAAGVFLICALGLAILVAALLGQ